MVPKHFEEQGNGQDYIKRSFMTFLICTPHFTLVIKLRKIRWDGHVTHYGGARDVHAGLWWGDLRERDHLEGLGLGGRIILKWIFKKWNGEAWTGLICFKKGTGCRGM